MHNTGYAKISEKMVEKVVLASPRGFCAGVVRAIDVVEIALRTYPNPVYVRKENVHNSHVVEELSQKGAIFVDSLEQIPVGETVIFSAHGVSPEVWEQARNRSLKIVDATCPLVTKVHDEAVRYSGRDYTIILIGHPGHDEVIGTMGEAPESMVLVSSVEDVERLAGGLALIGAKAADALHHLGDTALAAERVDANGFEAGDGRCAGGRV